MAKRRSDAQRTNAKYEAAFKRSQAAKKAAATRKRNARRGMKDVPPVTIKVDTTQPPQEFARMLRDEVARRVKTLMFAQAYSAGPNTLERLSTAPTSDPKLWRTATGSIVHIQTMSEEHLRNTVSYLARQLSSRLTSAPFVSTLQPGLDSLSAMLSECRRRGLQV